MIALHAVVPARADLGDTGGLQVHRAGDVAVLYDETPEPPPTDRPAVLRHGARIVALAEAVTVLPVRYGTTVAGSEELASVSEEHAGDWARRLAELEGLCELVVHVDTTKADSRAPGMSGRDYLRSRIVAQHRHDEALEEVRDRLGPWAVEVRTLPDADRVAVLVPRGDVDAVRAALDTRSRARTEVAVTGPWPPFSFCEELDPT